MFAELRDPGRKRRDWSIACAFAAQLAVVAVLLYPREPEFVVPHDVQQGIRGSSGSLSLMYLAPSGMEKSAPAVEPPHPKLRASLPLKPKPPVVQKKTSLPPNPVASDDAAARGGSTMGRLPGGLVTGEEVVPALPVVAPDPPVEAGEIPPGITGDVVVEVTIDSQGNVVKTKLLQTIGFGIEEKVLATLQRWHFRPASRFGVNIASQHLVHFHYPA
jgi:TonB family protein